jgi:hypothetical protein
VTTVSAIQFGDVLESKQNMSRTPVTHLNCTTGTITGREGINKMLLLAESITLMDWTSTGSTQLMTGGGVSLQIRRTLCPC